MGNRPLGVSLKLRGDLEEGFDPLKIPLGNIPGGLARGSVGNPGLGVSLLLFERGGIQVGRLDRFLEQDLCLVGEDLEHPVGLGPLLRLRIGDLEAEQARLQRSENRHVAGQNADLAGDGPGRELDHLAVEDLTLRGEDLNRECIFAGQLPRSP